MFEIKRYSGNPIMGPRPGVQWRGTARNPGVVWDGAKFHMVFTADPRPRDGVIRLGYAESRDGFHFTEQEGPWLAPSDDPSDFDHAGCEDARVTYLEGRYYIAYAGRSFNGLDYAAGIRRLGPGGNTNPVWTDNYRRVGLAVTDDFKTVEKLGPITSEHICDANVALFPERIGGKYAMIHRPTAFVPWMLPLHYHPGCVWLAFSEKLDYWSSNRREMPWNMVDGEDIMDEVLLLAPQQKWEQFKVGGSGVPIPTDDGWLMTYHGVDRQNVYRVGLALLDREDPRKVIARTPDPVFEPQDEWDTAKDWGLKCVFPCANVVVGDEVFMYYGCGDNYVSVATFSLKEALDHVKQYPQSNKNGN